MEEKEHNPTEINRFAIWVFKDSCSNRLFYQFSNLFLVLFNVGLVLKRWMWIEMGCLIHFCCLIFLASDHWISLIPRSRTSLNPIFIK